MNRNLLASAICASLLLAGTAHAQDNPAPAQQTQDQSTAQSSTTTQQQKKPETKTLETVTVSGSLLKRPEYQTLVPVQVVNLQAAEAAGQFGTANLLQTAAVANGSTQVNNQFGGFVVDGGLGTQTVNLRGLGASRTLVLLDGQRPGFAGTRGAIGAFDLNVIPQAILQRVEIVKDGSSSIYGSDAISGVVNLITKKRLDKTQLTFGVYAPEEGGGEQYVASVATGWNFNKGNITFAAQVDRQQQLTFGDRDFLSCSNDLIYGDHGQRIDRKDLSILEGTSLAGCNNLFVNVAINFGSGARWVPSRDGSTGVGSPIPGYVLRTRGRYDDGNPNGAFDTQVLNTPFYGEGYAINRQTRGTLYGATSFNFGPVDWDTQVLFNNRKTVHRDWRQFFPVIWDGTGTPDFTNFTNIWEPVMPFPFNSSVDVDYFYGRTKLSGAFTPTGSWTWEVNASYSRSSGRYNSIAIDTARTGDLTEDDNQLLLPPINYLDPCVLSGSCMQRLVDAVGTTTSGKTIYKQEDINAVVNGNLFELPAGPVSAAFGAEYRHYSIDDQPPPGTWGLSSALVTKGSDNVKEVFGEVGIPILKGLPAVDSLTADVSAREFRYGTVGENAHVWKYGLNWQVIPSFRFRGSLGTSYRAPTLAQLFLGNQTGFLGQLGIDPCINWADSTNDFIRTNCAAAGIPSNYTAAGNSSALVVSSGGAGTLKPENSRAKSLGFAWSPSFANLNVAVDYFDYNITGEVAQLGASNIIGGCYNSPVYPNQFCGMFDRNSPTGPSANKITEVRERFININSERTRGYDFQMNYAQDFSFGKVKADAQLTYTIEDTTQLFDSAEASGFTTSNFVGYIGRPRMVGVFDASLERGNWTYSWQGIYTSKTTDKDLTPYFNYLGYEHAFRQTSVHAQLRHSASVGWDDGTINVIFGVRNLFDQTPPEVSTGVGGPFSGARVGNVALDASQYDWFGRTYFARLNIKF